MRPECNRNPTWREPLFRWVRPPFRSRHGVAVRGSQRFADIGGFQETTVREGGSRIFNRLCARVGRLKNEGAGDGRPDN